MGVLADLRLGRYLDREMGKLEWNCGCWQCGANGSETMSRHGA